VHWKSSRKPSNSSDARSESWSTTSKLITSTIMGASVWILMASGGRMETYGKKITAHNASARYSLVPHVTIPVFEWCD
jgi:hypothetical protein